MINYISRDKLIEDCDYQIKKPSNKEVHVTMDEAFAHFKELVLPFHYNLRFIQEET